MRTVVFVAVYNHRYGNDVRVFTTEDKALAWRTAIAQEWWEEELRDEPKPDDATIGEEYFNALSDRCDEESFDIIVTELE